MLIRKKYQLPLFKKLPNIFFNVNQLVNELSSLDDQWTDVFSANVGLCSAHHKLANENYNHFEQINLTEFDGKIKENHFHSAEQECLRILSNFNELFGEISGYRAKTRKLSSIPPELNEHNWSKALPIYQGSNFKKLIESQFKAKPIRVRLAKLKKGSLLTPHIDYDPSYAVRIIVPLITNPSVKNIIWKHNKRYEFHLPADGGAYFLNVGFKHSVENNSNTDRISLMFSLDSQVDLINI